jgi:acyl-coenzyme A thioesterase PaaI-like protein
MHTFSEDRGGEPVGAVTAGYSVRLRRPTPIGHRVRLVARVTDHDDRHATVVVEATVGGELMATFEGHFVVVDLPDYDEG